jgi:hypothetical protein
MESRIITRAANMYFFIKASILNILWIGKKDDKLKKNNYKTNQYPHLLRGGIFFEEARVIM